MSHHLHHAYITKGSLFLVAIVGLSKLADEPLPRTVPASAAPDGSVSAAPCIRPKPRSWRDGETLVIRGDVDVPCTFTVHDTPITIVSDDAKVPILGQRLVRDRRGRFYTYAGGQIAAWNERGMLLRTFGRLGMGPGEFAGGALLILPAPNDQLYVLDNTRRLTVLDSGYRLIRTIAVNVGLGLGRTFVLADGTILDGSRPKNASAYFDIKRAQGTAPNSAWPEVVRSIGVISDAEVEFDQSERVRLVSDAGHNRFWAGPPSATGRGYEVELWSTSGTRMRTLRREVSWYPQNIDRAGPRTNQLSPPPAELETVQVVGDGLVWVTLVVPDATGWAAYSRDRSDTTAAGRAWNVYGELLDANAGVVLARTGRMYTKDARKSLPAGWFPSSLFGFRTFETPDGSPAFRILEAKLAAK